MTGRWGGIDQNHSIDGDNSDRDGVDSRIGGVLATEHARNTREHDREALVACACYVVGGSEPVGTRGEGGAPETQHSNFLKSHGVRHQATRRPALGLGSRAVALVPVERINGT